MPFVLNKGQKYKEKNIADIIIFGWIPEATSRDEAGKILIFPLIKSLS